MKKKTIRQYRVLAVVWSFAAVSMVAAVVRQLPRPSDFSLVLLLMSVLASILWWSAAIRAAKEQQPNRRIKGFGGKKHE